MIGSGLLQEWLVAGSELRFGPCLTAWGSVSVRREGAVLTLVVEWRGTGPRVTIAGPGITPIDAAPDERVFHLRSP